MQVYWLEKLSSTDYFYRRAAAKETKLFGSPPAELKTLCNSVSVTDRAANLHRRVNMKFLKHL
jgi:hypothetical protein